MGEDSIAYTNLGLPFGKSSAILSIGEHFQRVLEKHRNLVSYEDN